MVKVVRGLAAAGTLVAALIGVVALPAGAGQWTSSRAEYVDALIPVVEGEFRDEGLDGTAETFACVAEGYVDGFTLRRLRAVGSPESVARERARRDFDFDRFGVTRAQEARIVATAILGCMPLSQVLALAFETRGAELSLTSQACLDERFAADAGAVAAYRRNTVRQLAGKTPRLSAEMLRAGTILSECLTADEQRVVTAAA